MGSANSRCVISVPDRSQNGFPTTDVTASRSGSAATPRLIGARVGFCLLALALPAAAQWRTGYYMQAEAAGQTAATIPWSKYTHIIHSALRPTYTNGICGLDSNSGLLSASNVTDFVNAAHASDVKAIIGIREDDTRDAITACTAPQNIAQFVELIRTFVANSGYDGVDLDWESGIIAPQYQDLIRRLRTAMPTATLSVAVGIAERFMTAAVQDDLDQINIRAYNLDSQDLTGSAIHYSWFHSATLQGANTQDQAMDSLSWSYVYAGNASSKLGLAVPFYGRIRKGCLDSAGTTGVTDPNQAWVGRAEIGSILYRDLVNSTYWGLGTRVWDDSRKSQYIQYRDGGCAKDAFIPYLGPRQLQEIVSLIRANKLGGIATYSLPNEYIATEGGDARYPLSTAIDAAMSATASASVISKRSRLAATPSSSVTKAAAGASSTPPSITSPLPTALTGAPYSQTLTVTGTTPMTWTVTSGALPSGLTLGSSTGIISGMPAAPGIFTLTVTATNAVGSNYQQLSLTVNAPPTIVTTSPLPAALTGTAYSLTLAATGTTPMTWTVTGGALPSGLTLGASTGTISGTPSAVGVFTPTVSATNALGSNSQPLSLTVSAPTPPSIVTTSPLPAALTGAAYSQTLTATGATPMTWTVTSGALPSGLTLGSSIGIISGTPTAVGVFTPTVTATNGGGANSKQLSLTVNAPPTPPSIVTTSPLPTGLTGTAYSQTLTATGTTPMTWTVTGGALPAGLTLGSSIGIISGTPTALGVFTPTVTVTNAGGSNSKQLSLTVNAVLPEGGAFTYYVDSVNGSDSNPGTIAQPWKTVAKVNSTMLTPGQSLGFKRGGIWRETLVPGQSGTAGKPIVFGAYGTGPEPVISGADVLTPWTLLPASANVYCTAESTPPRAVWENNIQLNHATSTASLIPGSWYFDSPASRVCLRTSDNSTPASKVIESAKRYRVIVIASKDYVTIDGLRIEKTNDTWIGAVFIDGRAHGSTGVIIRNCTVAFGMSSLMAFSANNITFTSNLVFGDRNSDLAGVVTSQDTGNPCNNPTITYNTIHDLRFGTNQPLNTLMNTIGGTFSHNVIYNTSNYGIHFNLSRGPVIEHNVVHDGGTETSDTHGIHIADTTNAIIRENVVYNWHDPSLWSGGGIQVDNNSDDALVVGNMVYNNDGAGISILNAARALVYQNTCYSNNQRIGYGEISIMSPPDVGLNKASATLKNNIGYATRVGTYAIYIDHNSSGHSNVSDSNLWYNILGNWYYRAGGGSSPSDWNALTEVGNDIRTDPLLTDPNAGDFTLMPNSVCRKSGLYLPGISLADPPNIGAK